jgi:hypothetical protein
MMKGASLGVQRLALLLGVIGAAAWLIFAAVLIIASPGTGTPQDWVILVVVAGISFLIPFLLVHGIAWVIRGFREPDRDRPAERGKRTDPGEARTPGSNDLGSPLTGSSRDEESYGASELKIMKRQFGGWLRRIAIWYVLVLILAVVAALVTKFM